MTAILTIDGAQRNFGATRALDGASLTLRKGEWLGLLGPNGAGKTTLVKSIAGRVRLDAGTISLFGTTLEVGGSASTTARRRLGIVPQEIALYPMLTAAENLRSMGEFAGLSGSTLRDRVTWALDWTGLADRASDRVKTFSGGMKRRLNIACAVLHRPDVVLLDEPTVGVDPQSRHRIWEMLELLRRDGASLLLTTHQLDEAEQVCDRIVIIDHGKSIADGSMDELVGRTIGAERRVTVRLEPGGPATIGVWTAVDDVINTTVSDVAAELPPMLTTIQGAGGRITDVNVVAPSLNAVFLHLTGRDLRE